MNKAKWIFWMGLLGLALLGGLYLSGVLMFWRLDMPVQQVTLTTYGQYWIAYASHPAHGAVVRSSGWAGFALPLMLLLFVALLVVLRRKQNLYGNARFANLGDLRRKQMLVPDDTALVVGKMNGKFIYLNGQQFAMVAAPTRSGKGVGIVIPNLLSYQGSVVVLDIKGENFELTSGFRRRYGQEVYLFNPFAEDRRTHRWNPLAYVSDDAAFRVSDLQAIAAMLYPAVQLHKDPFWANQAQNAFLAFALYAFEQREFVMRRFPDSEAPPVPTIGDLQRMAAGRPGQDIKRHLEEMAQWKPLSTTARTAFGTLLSQADVTFASIMGTFKEPLNPWLNPVVDAATSGNDFDLRDVRKKRMSVYVVIQPNKLAESRLILNLFFSQLINENTRELPKSDPALKHQCLLLLDEFTSIGRVDIIANAVSFMAGYNLRLLPIIQSISQLESTYGKEVARTLLTNHALRIVFAPREQSDANEYSEMLGYTSVRKQSISRSRARDSSYTRSESEERRALMLPQEIKALGDDKQILILEGLAHPVMSKKIRYFKEAAFKHRLPPPVGVPVLPVANRLRPMPVDAPEVTHAAVAPQPPAYPPTVDASLFAAASMASNTAAESGTPPPEYTGLSGIVEEFDQAFESMKPPGSSGNRWEESADAGA